MNFLKRITKNNPRFLSEIISANFELSELFILENSSIGYYEKKIFWDYLKQNENVALC